MSRISDVYPSSGAGGLTRVDKFIAIIGSFFVMLGIGFLIYFFSQRDGETTGWAIGASFFGFIILMLGFYYLLNKGFMDSRYKQWFDKVMPLTLGAGTFFVIAIGILVLMYTLDPKEERDKRTPSTLNAFAPVSKPEKVEVTDEKGNDLTWFIDNNVISFNNFKPGEIQQRFFFDSSSGNLIFFSNTEMDIPSSVVVKSFGDKLKIGDVVNTFTSNLNETDKQLIYFEERKAEFDT